MMIKTDQQLTKVQRMRNCRTLNLKCGIHILSPLERLRDQCERQDRKLEEPATRTWIQENCPQENTGGEHMWTHRACESIISSMLNQNKYNYGKERLTWSLFLAKELLVTLVPGRGKARLFFFKNIDPGMSVTLLWKTAVQGIHG